MKSAFPFLVMFLVASCSDDSSDSVKDEVKSSVSAGTWRVTSFTEDDLDETAHFSGYNFTFGTGGDLTATNGTNTYTGSWSLSSNSSDDSYDDLDFNIAFTNPSEFEDLSEDWEVLNHTATRLELRHESGGDGRIERRRTEPRTPVNRSFQ